MVNGVGCCQKRCRDGPCDARSHLVPLDTPDQGAPLSTSAMSHDAVVLIKTRLESSLESKGREEFGRGRSSGEGTSPSKHRLTTSASELIVPDIVMLERTSGAGCFSRAMNCLMPYPPTPQCVDTFVSVTAALELLSTGYTPLRWLGPVPTGSSKGVGEELEVPNNDGSDDRSGLGFSRENGLRSTTADNWLDVGE